MKRIKQESCHQAPPLHHPPGSDPSDDSSTIGMPFLYFDWDKHIENEIANLGELQKQLQNENIAADKLLNIGYSLCWWQENLSKESLSFIEFQKSKEYIRLLLLEEVGIRIRTKMSMLRTKIKKRALYTDCRSPVLQLY